MYRVGYNVESDDESAEAPFASKDLGGGATVPFVSRGSPGARHPCTVATPQCSPTCKSSGRLGARGSPRAAQRSAIVWGHCEGRPVAHRPVAHPPGGPLTIDGRIAPAVLKPVDGASLLLAASDAGSPRNRQQGASGLLQPRAPPAAALPRRPARNIVTCACAMATARVRPRIPETATNSGSPKNSGSQAPWQPCGQTQESALSS